MSCGSWEGGDTMANTLNGEAVPHPGGWPRISTYPPGYVRCMAHQRKIEGPCDATVFQINGPDGGWFRICVDCLRREFNAGGLKQ